MTSSSSAQAARQRVADQLKQLRLDARMTGRALATAARWHGVSKVSKIEHAARPPSVADIRVWCAVCGVSEQRADELVAELLAAESMWQDWRAAERTGLMHLHAQVRDMYQETRLVRAYTSKIMPGLLQTPDYGRAVLSAIRDGRGVPVDDVEVAIEERTRRQRVLRMVGHRFVFVLEEAVLGYRIAPEDVMAAQLRHLLDMARLPSVSLAVIPADVDRTRQCPTESFDIWDDIRVTVELVSGYLTVTSHGEIEQYVHTFRELLEVAVHGARARALVETAARPFR